MEKYPILILHGWNLSREKFDPLKIALKHYQYRIFNIDLPGFGKTVKPERPLYLSDYTDYVCDYLKKMKLSKINLIGHSFGGRIAIKLAYNHPELLNTLILIGAPGINPVSKTKITFFLFLSKIGKLIFLILPLSHFQNFARKILYRAAKATDFYNTDSRLRETFKNVIKENLGSYLRRIKIPTFLLWGQDDTTVPVKIAQKMSSLIRHSRLKIIPSAKHGLPWTHPEITAREIHSFISTI